MRILIPSLALLACHPASREILVPILVPVPVPAQTAVFEAFPPGPLPASRTVIRVVDGFVHYDDCPSEKTLWVSPEHPGADEPPSIDLDGAGFCKALLAGPEDPDRRYFVAEIALTPRWRQPGCDQGNTKTWCHGWETDSIGTITRMVPATDRDDADAVRAQITAHGFPPDAIR